jgi:hypothetical protein
MSKAKVLTMPAMPGAIRVRRSHQGDPRYVEGQRLIAQAIRYLVQSDPERNVPAVALLSEHFRTRFRMSDKPDVLQPQP